MPSERKAELAVKSVEMKGITKSFGSFKANDSVDLTLHKGEIQAILGENGAGKSTLMNILYGIIKPTSGEIFIDGKKVVMDSPLKAIANGIGMVHQHFMLIEPFTVTENIVLGMEPVKNFKCLDMDSARKKVLEISKQYGLSVDPDAKIEDISVGMQQRVEILKVLYRGANTLIFDEPTASLTPQEIKELINIMHNLAQEGKSILIITHKLKEIKETADTCIIIRAGKLMGKVHVDETTEEELASLMVGRSVEFHVTKEEKEAGETVLEVNDLVVKNYQNINVVNGLNLTVKRGEILGIAGVDGNGQTEFIEALTGLRKAQSGKITVCGNNIFNLTPRKIFDAGVSSIPEDRQKFGLVLDFSVSENMVLQNHKNFSKNGFLNRSAILAHSSELVEKFDVRPRGCENSRTASLSGGNQQKVIIAREITNNKDLLVCVNPTRGLDVGAIEYVHKYIVEARNQNKAVLLVSFELDEIMSLSDRIEVIFEGKISGSFDASAADESRLGYLMAGGGENVG